MGEGVAAAVAGLVAVVAREIESELGVRTPEMVGNLIEMIPALRTDNDDDIRELLVASVSSNLATGLHILEHNIPVDQVEVPAAAAYYARRLAQRDVPVEALLRAYRLGQSLFLQWWLHVMERHQVRHSILIAASKHTAYVTASYIDRICENLTAIYSEERALWAQRASASRAAQVRTVLLDEELDRATAEAITGYRMDGVHVGLVAWSTSVDSGNEVESAVHVITEATGLRPLAVLADDRTMWAWLSGLSSVTVEVAALSVALARRGSEIRLALGSPSRGLVGFRASHHEALCAQRVANARGDDCAQITVFSEVVLSAFLARDLRAARHWVAAVLGSLAIDDDAMAELRRTVLLFLRTGSCLTEAAGCLNLHKNTVRYRLRKAEDARGAPVSERRLDLELALMACLHLGPAVLIQDRSVARRRRSR